MGWGRRGPDGGRVDLLYLGWVRTRTFSWQFFLASSFSFCSFVFPGHRFSPLLYLFLAFPKEKLTFQGPEEGGAEVKQR